MSREPIDGARLSAAMEPWRLRLLETTGSTNADAAQAARHGEAEGLVVMAESQTAGRGRLGRSWTSAPRAGLAMSVLLRPAAPMELRGWLPLLAGVALSEAIRETVAIPAADVGLKWPNDLLIAGRKCAGILAEAVIMGGAASPRCCRDSADAAGSVGRSSRPHPAETPGNAVVVGIGVNVSLTEPELPQSPHGLPATSLMLAGAGPVDRTDLAAAVLRRLRQRYDRWQAGVDDLRQAYLNECVTIGRDVRIVLPGGSEVTGRAATVDSFGRLIVQTLTGDVCPIAAGDVTHVR